MLMHVAAHRFQLPPSIPSRYYISLGFQEPKRYKYKLSKVKDTVKAIGMKYDAIGWKLKASGNTSVQLF